MLIEVEGITGKQMNELVALGLVLSFEATYRNRDVGDLFSWVQPAISLNQIAFFSDYRKGVVGYATWAFFDDDDLSDFQSHSSVPPDIEDWNSGANACIVDFVAIKEAYLQTARELKQLIKQTHSKVFYLRDQQLKRMDFKS